MFHARVQRHIEHQKETGVHPAQRGTLYFHFITTYLLRYPFFKLLHLHRDIRAREKPSAAHAARTNRPNRASLFLPHLWTLYSRGIHVFNSGCNNTCIAPAGTLLFTNAHNGYIYIYIQINMSCSNHELWLSPGPRSLAGCYALPLSTHSPQQCRQKNAARYPRRQFRRRTPTGCGSCINRLQGKRQTSCMPQSSYTWSSTTLCCTLRIPVCNTCWRLKLPRV